MLVFQWLILKELVKQLKVGREIQFYSSSTRIIKFLLLQNYKSG